MSTLAIVVLALLMAGLAAGLLRMRRRLAPIRARKNGPRLAAVTLPPPGSSSACPGSHPAGPRFRERLIAHGRKTARSAPAVRVGEVQCDPRPSRRDQVVHGGGWG